MSKKFIAYIGSEFIIEWYFDERGRSQALEYYEALNSSQKQKLYHLFYVLADTGLIRNEKRFRNEGNQIYAFKPMPDRFLCFFYQGSKIVVTNAFVKKCDKLPVKEKEKALRAKADYISKCVRGLYYD